MSTPNLDAALVAAQAEAKSLKRDGKNQHGGYKYATADQVADLGRQLLTKHGLAWSRVSHTLRAPTLALADIGNQAYVGDVVITWKLRHAATGEQDTGIAEYPVIAAKQRPHEKAVAASVTYGCGQIIQGLLCWDREDEKHAVDRRGDGDSDDDHKPPPKTNRKPADEPKCTGHGQPIADANRALTLQLAELTGDKPGKLWREWCRAAKIPPSTDGHPPTAEQLTVTQGKTLKGLLESAIDHHRAEQPEREPGDDPDDDEVPEDDAAAMRAAEDVRNRLERGGLKAESGSVHKTGRGARARGGEAPA